MPNTTRSGRSARAPPGRSSGRCARTSDSSGTAITSDRADRDDKADKIFYREMRLYAGIRFDLKHIDFEVSGGWAFNRFYFEGEGYSDRHDNRIDVGDAPFIVGKMNLRF